MHGVGVQDWTHTLSPDYESMHGVGVQGWTHTLSPNYESMHGVGVQDWTYWTYESMYSVGVQDWTQTLSPDRPVARGGQGGQLTPTLRTKGPLFGTSRVKLLRPITING